MAGAFLFARYSLVKRLFREIVCILSSERKNALRTQGNAIKRAFETMLYILFLCFLIVTKI